MQILGPGESAAAPAGAAGCLDVQAADVTIEGLDIGNCQVGIELQTPGGDDVYDNLVGLAPDGKTKSACNDGIWISDSPDNMVGGNAVDDRNVISGDGTGVFISGTGSTGNEVQGNLIGTDTSGTAFVPDTYGVELLDSSHDTIGATGVAIASAGSPPGNVIDATAGKGNFAVGVFGMSATASDDLVSGNLIGTDASGGATPGPGAGPGFGVVLAGTVSHNTVGAGNVLAAATTAQVFVDSTDAADNTINRNQIGSSRSGTVALPSPDARGILTAGAAHTTISDNAVTAQKFGIAIQARPAKFPAVQGVGTVPGTASGTGTTEASVTGNIVGPLPDGRKVPADGEERGISDSGGTGDVIGPGNQVSWNRIGVLLVLVDKTTLEGNLIGTNRAGTVALPDGIGVALSHGKSVTIGVLSHPDTISGSTVDLLIVGSTRTIVRRELVGTTKLGNAAVKPFSGKLPWGDLTGKTIELPIGEFETDNPLGIAVFTGSGTEIGGPRPGQGDVTSGIPDGTGIELEGPALLLRDKIGVGQNGRSAVPNGDAGVLVDGSGASDSLIVGSTIAHNAGGGVSIRDANKVKVELSTVFDNHRGGIVYEGADDAPFAPEMLAAADVSLKLGSGKKFVGIAFTLDADVPSGGKGEVDFFATPTCEDHGAGKEYLGSATLAPGHHAKVLKLIATRQAVGTAITSTLTTDDNGTSRFSNCAILAPQAT